jgi:TPR repeat protein
MKLKVLVLALLISTGWVNVASADAGYDAYEKGNYSEAYKIWKPKADSGEAYAQNSIGHLYYQGEGVLKDERKGLDWHEKAAFNGLAEAQRRMAIHYLDKISNLDEYSMSMGWGNHYFSTARFWIEKLNNNQNSSIKHKNEAKEWWNEFEIWKYSVDKLLIKKEEKSNSLFGKARSWFD